ncbi:MAG: STAS domain-containing protein [Phycisphaerales bacterium]
MMHAPLNSPRGPQSLDVSTAFDAFTEAKQIARVYADPNAITIAPLNPSLGDREAHPIVEAAMRAIEQRPARARYLVFDLSEVRTMTAYGLGLCNDLAKRAREAGLEPVLYGASRDTIDGLRLFKTDRLYKIVRSRDDLVALVHR